MGMVIIELYKILNYCPILWSRWLFNLLRLILTSRGTFFILFEIILWAWRILLRKRFILLQYLNTFIFLAFVLGWLKILYLSFFNFPQNSLLFLLLTVFIHHLVFHNCLLIEGLDHIFTNFCPWSIIDKANSIVAFVIVKFGDDGRVV